MTDVAILGMGAMGSRMAANLLKARHRVTVWNRTPAAKTALVSAGARRADTPREAAKAADVVIAMLRDDEASRAVWLDAVDGALGGMRRGAFAIESSTLSPDWIRRLGSTAQAHGVALLEAPVSGSRPQAEAGQLTYLVGGEAATLERLRELLLAMGSSIHHVGPLGAGALAKLSTNALLGIEVTALAEIIGLLKRNGADVRATLTAMSGTSAWPPAAHYLASTMIAGDFRPQFPVELIEKDFGYAVTAAGSPDLAPTLNAARHVFREAIARGLGADNMSTVAKLFN